MRALIEVEVPDDDPSELLDRVIELSGDEDASVELIEGGRFTCAECGTTTAQTYVVTTLEHADRWTTQTEVCRSCDNDLRKRGD
jgi:DNA-directed RNA polymerase subunit M/transcription elongation factor TFIIS